MFAFFVNNKENNNNNNNNDGRKQFKARSCEGQKETKWCERQRDGVEICLFSSS